MRERWTDDRLDDLNGKVDALRLEMKAEFATVRGEMNQRFSGVDQRFVGIDQRLDKIDQRLDKIDQRFEKIDDRFESMGERLERAFQGVEERLQAMDQRLLDTHRTMSGFCIAMLVAVVGLIATQV